MQQLLEKVETRGTEQNRMSVVETLATTGRHGESVAEVAHDARNMVTALGLYCDLLEEPGVLSVPFLHYGNELRLVAAASRRLVEKLATLDESRQNGSLARPVRFATQSETSSAGQTIAREFDRDFTREPLSRRRETASRWELIPATFIENMAAELLANHNLLAALAGPMAVLTVDVAGGARGVRITGEDLTRVLVNLVKNAAEAMPSGGRIQIELHELGAAAGTVETLMLTMEDNGPGIPEEALETIFNSGYTTRAQSAAAPGSWPVLHRGLGLAISRSIVEAAGGRITASNRATNGENRGARFTIELPVRAGRR